MLATATYYHKHIFTVCFAMPAMIFSLFSVSWAVRFSDCWWLDYSQLYVVLIIICLQHVNLVILEHLIGVFEKGGSGSWFWIEALFVEIIALKNGSSCYCTFSKPLTEFHILHKLPPYSDTVTNIIAIWWYKFLPRHVQLIFTWC